MLKRAAAIAIIFSLSLFFVANNAALASDVGIGLSNDPDNQGYYRQGEKLEPVEWDSIRTNCAPCRALVNSYNESMKALFKARYTVEHIKDVRTEADKYATGTTIEDYSGNQGMGDAYERAVAASLGKKEAADALAAQAPELEKTIRDLEASTNALRAHIAECEKQCDREGSIREVMDGGGGGAVSQGLPFEWRGPYPEVCKKCAKLSARLNELPALARRAMANIERARAQKKLAELGALEVRALGNAGAASDATDKQEKAQRKSLQQYERDIKKAEDEIAANEADLDEIEHNFKYTLDAYNKCVPTCTQQTGSVVDPDKKKGGCHYAALPDHFLIGPNSQYGSGAVMKDKITDMATGSAMSALGGILGGGGVSLGGMDKGGGGMQRIDPPAANSGQQGPKTDSDPTKGEWTNFGTDGYDMGYRTILTADNGLSVSVKINDAPGDGTFHAAFLQDGKGKTITPDRYWIYELYQDWKLTVWWTYDRWVDGQHVEHDEGREVTTGRDTVARWKQYDKAENSIWSEMGFGTAAKGIKTLGMEYDLSTLDLSCPLQMTTYITAPEKDPVIAMPVRTEYIPPMGRITY